MPDINDFKDLRIWQKGIIIVEKCYFLTKLFPKDELYGMVQQIRRSAASIPANIAEGYGRDSDKELARFVDISMGSSFELRCQLLIARDLGYVAQSQYELFESKILEVNRMLGGLLKKLRA